MNRAYRSTLCPSARSADSTDFSDVLPAAQGPRCLRSPRPARVFGSPALACPALACGTRREDPKLPDSAWFRVRAGLRLAGGSPAFAIALGKWAAPGVWAVCLSGSLCLLVS